jgi:hypothetical protein
LKKVLDTKVAYLQRVGERVCGATKTCDNIHIRTVHIDGIKVVIIHQLIH